MRKMYFKDKGELKETVQPEDILPVAKMIVFSLSLVVENTDYNLANVLWSLAYIQNIL